MASIKIIFRTSSPNGREGTLYYRIIHQRKVRQIHTGFRIFRDEWNEQESQVISCGRSARQEYLNDVRQKLNGNLLRLKRIVSGLDNSGKEYTSLEVVERYLNADTVVGFISFSRKLIEENRRMDKASVVEHYSSALNSFIRFHGDGELPFDEFDSKLMRRYEYHLKGLGLTLNTISYYMRKLRAIYNIAVDRELTLQRSPFRHVYTGIAKTKKRAVSIDVIRLLLDMDLSHDPLSAFARDMFLFSFYTRGMSMVDMAYLRKGNLRNGMLTYRRQKTNQELKIRWEARMQEIVARHGIPDSDYLLPLIKTDDSSHRRQYRNAQHMINRRLRNLGNLIGLTEPLTMYRARHSWASIAQDNGVPVSIISQGMGHDSEKTTRIYLASLDTSKVDKANNAIMSLLDK